MYLFQMFAEAEKAFMQVLVLDKNSDDSVLELLRVRTHQLMVSLAFHCPQFLI